jgi:glutamyl/glutaminyl-tRNA synthetase
MKRNEIVKSLLKEGFSEKTLLNFSDKQLIELSKRIFFEEVGNVVMSKNVNPQDILKMTNQGLNVELKEKKLVGNQKKIDANKNGKIDPEDFKLLRSKKDSKKTEKKEVKELVGNQKKIDANKNNKIDPEDFKLLRSKKDSKKTEKKEVKEWVNRLAENNFHSFTSKNEIMELIKTKINEVEVGPNVKKGHNGIPEFMSYEAITKPAPTKPKVDPGTKPRTPYSPKPGEKSKPKALKEKKDANK